MVWIMHQLHQLHHTQCVLHNCITHNALRVQWRDDVTYEGHVGQLINRRQLH